MTPVQEQAAVGLCEVLGKRRRHGRRGTPRDTAADWRDGSCVRHQRPRKAASVARRQTEGKRRRWGCVKCWGNGGGNTAALALLLHTVYTLNAAQLQAKGLQIG